MNDIEQHINACDWFKDLPETAINTLVKSARIKHFKDKTYLYRLGSSGEFVFGIISGVVRVKISSIQGQEFSITEFSADDWIGEFALTGQTERLVDAQALKDSSLIEIPKCVVKTLADQYPIIYKHLFLQQAERTSKMCELLAGMLFYPLKSRLAGRLRWLAQNYGELCDEGIQISKKFNQQELAELTMGSRQRVNKILNAWQTDNVIEIKGQRYLIKDMDQLKQEMRLKDE